MGINVKDRMDGGQRGRVINRIPKQSSILLQRIDNT